MERRVELVRRTDPRNIYIENIRSFFGIPFSVAKFFCDVAVREGVFSKRIGYLCPQDKNVIISAPPGVDLPEQVVCWVCQSEDRDEFEFSTGSLETIEIYSVANLPNAESATV